MATLFAHKASPHGWGGQWVLKDGDVELATALDGLTRLRLEIEAGGRRFTASERHRRTGFEVVEDATGQQVADLAFTFFQDSGRNRGEVAAVNLATGATMAWNHLPHDRKLGFYETTGAPVILVAHHVRFEPSARHGTFRTLMRFWGSIIKAQDQFQIHVEDAAVGRLVRPEELPILALLGIWLVITYDRRHNISH
ncbi:MAG: hypothetical protein ACRD29_21925 [Acidimicrobiales bacterium]